MEVWSEFTRDPRDRAHQPLRASDHDRLLVQQVLAEAYADGRLDRAEYDERTEAARTVRTLGDVWPLLRDLVAARPASGDSLARATRSDLERLAHRHWVAKRREATFSFLGLSAVTSTIWFLTCFGSGGFEPYFFWPMFIIVFSLLNLLRTLTNREGIVEDQLRRLEKKQAKELRSRPGRGPGWNPLDWKP